MNDEPGPRTYQSPLREEQARRTRERILDAVLETMKEGLAELSVPAVARGAKVSVATVYRHFPTKSELFEAVREHVGRRTGLTSVRPPEDPEALYAWMGEVYARHAETDPTATAAMAGVLGGTVRRETLIPRRLALLDKALAPAMQGLPPEERTHLRNAAVLLSASSTYRTFEGYLGLSVEEATATANWILRTLLEAAEKKKGGPR